MFSQQPIWTTNKPSYKNYYIGIGGIEKTKQNYSEKAKELALSQIASEISVIISNKILKEIKERNNTITEEFYSQIVISTKAELEGYELVDTWQNKNQYWVYYRLSKDYYQKIKNEKYNKAVNSSLDYYSKAIYQLKSGKIENSLSNCFLAFNSINNYLYKPIEITYKGAKIFLINELLNLTKDVLKQIQLKFNTFHYNLMMGESVNNLIFVKATACNSQTNIPNLPISYQFTKGRGNIIGELNTNLSGISKINHLKVTAPEETQIIEAKLDISKYFSKSNLSENIFFNKIIKTLVIPKTEILLNVRKIKLYFNCSSDLSIQKLTILSVCPKIISFFSRNGCVVVKDSRQANYHINLEVNFTNGSQLYGMYSSFADATIIISNKKGINIYKNNISNIKGIGIDSKKASINTSANVAAEIIKDLKKNAFDGLFIQKN